MSESTPRPRQKPKGRTTECASEHVTRIICEGIEAGLFYGEACRLAKVHYTSFTRWMRRGATGEEPYASFRAAVDEAKAKSVATIIQGIRAAGVKDWRALAWIAENRWPKWRQSKGAIEVKAAKATAEPDLSRLSNAELLGYFELRAKCAVNDAERIEWEKLAEALA